MEYNIKRFNELNVNQLYEILKLRSQIFVVDLECPLKEIDGLDPQALHGWIEEEGKILAYVRILNKGVQSDNITIGRVFSVERNKGYGKIVMEKAINSIKELGYDKVFLASQSHAKGFYEKLGFNAVSEEYIDENGLAHVDMEYIIK